MYLSSLYLHLGNNIFCLVNNKLKSQIFDVLILLLIYFRLLLFKTRPPSYSQNTLYCHKYKMNMKCNVNIKLNLHMTYSGKYTLKFYI